MSSSHCFMVWLSFNGIHWQWSYLYQLHEQSQRSVVLLPNPFFGIDNHQSHIWAVDGTSAHDRIFLSVFIDFTRFALAFAVDHGKFLAIIGKWVSLASRVVPTAGLAMTRSSPRIALIKLGFPTFGRPIKLNLMISSFLLLCHSEDFRWWHRAHPSSDPWTKIPSSGSPSPRHKSHRYHCASRLSTLLTARITSLWVLYKIQWHIHPSVIPFPETTKTIICFALNFCLMLDLLHIDQIPNMMI